ncbi:hypothetical protein [Brevibacillus borstelensis]|uniref:hypothetical protein n=1 Tax=Brevibacillus borstelensis TaxID=45462 RepID=UPI0004F2DB14|nr:hypothetical protein [Brevibacillus borstelensis]KKX56357.1 hypothetical protein X546_04545 [Brevibacillus borstelensis cifa_chp40]
MFARVVVTNMGNEMFNDGLFYTEQAELHKDQQFNKWRYCRSAIICFCVAAEAELAKLIAHSLRKQPHLSPEYTEILLFLTDPNSDKPIPKKLKNIRKKYNLLRRLNGLRPQKPDQRYMELTELRNKIIHYTFSSHEDVYAGTILDSTKIARDAVRDFIADLYSIVRETPPEWVNNNSSIDIQ